MYTKVVYDYFNSNSEKFKFNSNKLKRVNAFKRKTTKQTVVVPKKSNGCTKIQKSSSPTEEKVTQTMANKSTVNVVYDTVQCIWKYAKSFISNQNSDSRRSQDSLRKNIKYRNNNLKYSRTSSKETQCFDKKDSSEPRKAANNIEQFQQEINDQINKASIEKATHYDKKDSKDFLATTEHEISINLPVKAQSSTELNFEILADNTVCKDFNLSSINNKTSNNTNKEIENKPADDTSDEKSTKKQHKEKLTEIFAKQQNNHYKSENLNAEEVQILKSSMKTYGRGKRKNKKLHVHFKDDLDNEKPKYSSYKSKNLRKSDCYHPNAFRKSKHSLRKNKSANSISGKKRRLALCTKNSRSSYKKKRSKRCSSSSISMQSKSSDSCENKIAKKAVRTPKKYSVYARRKIYKGKRAKICKKASDNEKRIKTLQQMIKTITDTNLVAPVNISHKDNNEVISTINIDDELCSPHHSNIYLHDSDDNLFGKCNDIIESSDILKELNEFTEFINDDQLDITSLESTLNNIENV